ncbi:GSCOCG00006745001-RA-CDS [Cotesia congregata]|uniref:Uncharacterized protein n=1 Tax=Cotesia congregata TaxID=51543 RepID=A0A8J2H7N1_COTCN|nr:GSCOCG00006745001-RA-CDS [Cotesia congregata]CAG5078947.1 Protein of unknown function [Cotesia congregata]
MKSAVYLFCVVILVTASQAWIVRNKYGVVVYNSKSTTDSGFFETPTPDAASVPTTQKPPDAESHDALLSKLRSTISNLRDEVFKSRNSLSSVGLNVNQS